MIIIKLSAWHNLEYPKTLLSGHAFERLSWVDELECKDAPPIGDTFPWWFPNCIRGVVGEDSTLLPFSAFWLDVLWAAPHPLVTVAALLKI